MKKKRRAQRQDSRPRTNSLPNDAPPSTSTSPCLRVRTFLTTPKGIVNCGDSYSSISMRSLSSSGCREADGGGGGGEDTVEEKAPPLHKAVILGAPGTGKTTLAQQMITSECLVNNDVLTGKPIMMS